MPAPKPTLPTTPATPPGAGAPNTNPPGSAQATTTPTPPAPPPPPPPPPRRVPGSVPPPPLPTRPSGVGAPPPPPPPPPPRTTGSAQLRQPSGASGSATPPPPPPVGGAGAVASASSALRSKLLTDEQQEASIRNAHRAIGTIFLDRIQKAEESRLQLTWKAYQDSKDPKKKKSEEEKNTALQNLLLVLRAYETGISQRTEEDEELLPTVKKETTRVQAEQARERAEQARLSAERKALQAATSAASAGTAPGLTFAQQRFIASAKVEKKIIEQRLQLRLGMELSLFCSGVIRAGNEHVLMIRLTQLETVAELCNQDLNDLKNAQKLHDAFYGIGTVGPIMKELSIDSSVPSKDFPDALVGSIQAIGSSVDLSAREMSVTSFNTIKGIFARLGLMLKMSTLALPESLADLEIASRRNIEMAAAVARELEARKAEQAAADAARAARASRVSAAGSAAAAPAPAAAVPAPADAAPAPDATSAPTPAATSAKPRVVENPWLGIADTDASYREALRRTTEICSQEVQNAELNGSAIAEIMYTASGEASGSAAARAAVIAEAYKALASRTDVTPQIRQDVAEAFFERILTGPSILERLQGSGATLLKAAALGATTFGILGVAETFATEVFAVSIFMNASIVVPVILLASIVPRVFLAVVNAVRRKQAGRSTKQRASEIIRASIASVASLEGAPEIARNIVLAAQRIFVGLDKSTILPAVRSGLVDATPTQYKAIITACERLSPTSRIQWLNLALGTNFGGGRAAAGR